MGGTHSSRIKLSGDPAFFGFQQFELVLDSEFFTLESGKAQIIGRRPRHFIRYLILQGTMFFTQFSGMCIKRHRLLQFGPNLNSMSVTN